MNLSYMNEKGGGVYVMTRNSLLISKIGILNPHKLVAVIFIHFIYDPISGDFKFPILLIFKLPIIWRLIKDGK